MSFSWTSIVIRKVRKYALDYLSVFREKPKTGKISWSVLLVLAVIVVYFAVVQICLRHYETALERDSVEILNGVTYWHQTGEYVPSEKKGIFVPPFALYCYRLPLALGIPLETGILFLTLLLGMSVPVLFYLLVREFCGSNEVALVSAALMAGNPYLHDIYKSILRDPVFIPLALLTCWLLLCNYNRPGIRLSCLAGLFSALSFLTRYEGGLFPAIFIGIMVLLLLRDRDWKKVLKMSFLYLLCWSISLWALLYGWGVWDTALRIYAWRFSTL